MQDKGGCPMMRYWLALPLILLACGAAPAPPSVTPPGDPFQPPEMPTAAGAPVIYEHSGEAGPDQTFFLVGEGLTDDVIAWGVSADRPGGQEWKLRVQLVSPSYLAATLPENAHDGPFLVRVRNKAGASAPIVLNAPQPWWCAPDVNETGFSIRVFGRNLARRPDFDRAFVYICPAGKPGVWVKTVETGMNSGKYEISFQVPVALAAGDYQVWLHAGAGGPWGWGGPVPLKIRSDDHKLVPERILEPGITGVELQRALDESARKGGGRVKLSPGTYPITTTLRIPSRVELASISTVRTSLTQINS
jgi:hypothetical protein